MERLLLLLLSVIFIINLSENKKNWKIFDDDLIFIVINVQNNTLTSLFSSFMRIIKWIDIKKDPQKIAKYK